MVKLYRKLSRLIPFLTLCAILIISAILIAYGRGYRLDLTKRTIQPTGLIATTSDPIGAQIYVGGILRAATNNSFNIEPGTHTIRIEKEGFQPWQKDISILGEVATRADAFLFPTNPSLSPLTTAGIQNPILSPDGTKIAYIIPRRLPSLESNGAVSRAGLWIYELADRPLGRNRDPQQLVAEGQLPFPVSQATLLWSPDSSQILFISGARAYLQQLTGTKAGADVSLTLLQLLSRWDEEKRAKDRVKLAAFPVELVNIATQSAKIISFSPDESKLLYEATASATIPPILTPALIGTNSTKEERTISPGKLYVYDIKEDKNFLLMDKKEISQITPTPAKKLTSNKNQQYNNRTIQQFPIFWFPTSRHLVLLLEGKIDILEYDRTNWITVYSGPFIDSFLAVWPTGSRLIVMTNLNPSTQDLPNLYTINLR